MAGHIEFRHQANAAIARVGDQVADFILRVIKGVGAQFVKFRKFPALHTKALVLREVPVENVHLHGFHAVEIPANDVERNKMAGGIDHQTTPWETRLVLDRGCGYGKSVGRHIHELQKCLQPVHRSERRSGPEPCTRRAHVKDVGFILADFLNLFARVIGLNHERGFSGLRGLQRERETCLARELTQESLTGALQAGLDISRERHGKRGVHAQAACSRLHVRGKGHEIQCRLLSYSHCRVQQTAKNEYAKSLQTRILSHGPENPPSQGSKSLLTAMYHEPWHTVISSPSCEEDFT